MFALNDGISLQSDEQITSNLEASFLTVNAGSAIFISPGWIMQKLTYAKLANLNAISKCRKSEKYGRLASDSKPDGELKPGVACTNKLKYDDESKKKTQKKSLKFLGAYLSPTLSTTSVHEAQYSNTSILVTSSHANLIRTVG